MSDLPDRVAYAVMFLRMAATETRKLAEDNPEIARELLHIADELRGEAYALAGQITSEEFGGQATASRCGLDVRC